MASPVVEFAPVAGSFIASGESDANRQLPHLRQDTPDVEAELRGALLSGVGDKRNALALAGVARASLDASTLAEWEQLLQREDLLTIAAAVSAPALYFHAAADELVPMAAPDAGQSAHKGTLRVVPAKSGMDGWRNRAAVREIVQFLKTGPGPKPTPARSRPGQTAPPIPPVSPIERSK